MEAEKKYAETYGGKVGGILPLLGMIAAIVVLCFTGMSSLRNFWGAGFMAMVIGLLVFKDKNRYACYPGIQNIFITSWYISRASCIRFWTRR